MERDGAKAYPGMGAVRSSYGIQWQRLMRLQGLSSKLQGLQCSLAFWSSEQFADTELAGSVLRLSIGSTDKQDAITSTFNTFCLSQEEFAMSGLAACMRPAPCWRADYGSAADCS